MFLSNPGAGSVGGWVQLSATDESPLFFLFSCCCCCWFGYVVAFVNVVIVVGLVFMAVYGHIIIASTQICDPSFSKLVHSWNHLFTSHSVSRKPTHPPVFIAPRILVYRKMWFLWLNRRYLPIFDGFLPVVQSNINRFRNDFHSQIFLGKFYSIAAQSLSRHKLHSMKIIIETFSGDNRFPCVSSVVFEANSIWILQNVLACQFEQFDTTHDFLGRKLTKLGNSIFMSARDCFRERRLF